MGLLDDAIREHLELKLRRGADPAEVARQEDEALGDPRRGEFAQPGAGPEEGAPPAEGDAVGAVAAGPMPEAEPDEPIAAPEDEPWLEEEPVARTPEADFATPPEEPEPEAVRPDEEPGPDADVLGETPDFLQETPEHDRLWFEQKPPRGFDFDS